MKSMLAALPVFLAPFILAFSAQAGVVASGGQMVALPTLSLTRMGGNVAPPFNHFSCNLYKTSRVQINLGDRPSVNRELVFTAAVPSVQEMLALVNQASLGRVKSVAGGNPDAGTSVYGAWMEMRVHRSNVILKDTSFMRGRLNDSNAAASLIEFIDLNCAI